MILCVEIEPGIFYDKFYSDVLRSQQPVKNTLGSSYLNFSLQILKIIVCFLIMFNITLYNIALEL